MSNFTRQHRLLKKENFQLVFNNGSKLRRKLLIVLSIPNHLSHARLGIVISKQSVPKAVFRNNLRRIIRESFRRSAHKLKSLDIITLVRSLADLKRDKEAIRVEIEQLWAEMAKKS